MRIIAGSAKGTTLVSPPDRSVRPTLDRVREACFSILGPRLIGARFLDLFAGTGANGLEALSRGAAHSDFVESNRATRAIIEQNIARTKFQDRAMIHASTLPEGLSRLAADRPYDVIYADPPHAFDDYTGLFTALGNAQLLARDGVVILEHASRTSVPDELSTFRRVRDTTYGETTLSFFESKPDAG
jgi:16S rRNA (guanine(966)-N(2))-methyltransferase RsmD